MAGEAIDITREELPFPPAVVVKARSRLSIATLLQFVSLLAAVILFVIADGGRPAPWTTPAAWTALGIAIVLQIVMVALAYRIVAAIFSPPVGVVVAIAASIPVVHLPLLVVVDLMAVVQLQKLRLPMGSFGGTGKTMRTIRERGWD